MKDHGGFPSNDWPNGLQYCKLAVVGAGAAAPVAPTDGSTFPNYPKKANILSRLAAEIPARSGVGAYTIQYDAGFQCPRILYAAAEVFGTTGAWAQVSAVNQATRTITVKVFAAAGAAADLANGTDLLVIDLCFQDSNG